jgi:WD40 repeat protein
VGPKSAVFLGHSDCIYTMEYGPGPGDFFSSGADGQVVMWNIKNPEIGKLVARTNGTVYALCYIKTLNKLLIAVNNDGIHRIDLESGIEDWNYPTPGLNWFRMKQLKSKIFIAGSGGSFLSLDQDSMEIKSTKIGNSDLRALSIKEDQNLISVGNSLGEIYLINPDFSLSFSMPFAHQKTVFGLAFYPISTKMVSAGRDAKLTLWSIEEENQIRKANSISAHLFGIHDVVVHPSKPILATASMDKTIKIWDAESLKLLRVLDKSRHAGHGHSINQLLWLEEQELLLSCSDDRTISAWNIFE